MLLLLLSLLSLSSFAVVVVVVVVVVCRLLFLLFAPLFLSTARAQRSARAIDAHCEGGAAELGPAPTPSHFRTGNPREHKCMCRTMHVFHPTFEVNTSLLHPRDTNPRRNPPHLTGALSLREAVWKFVFFCTANP